MKPDALEPASRRIFDDGLVLILKELHDWLDHAVADAYGWPADASDDDILARDLPPVFWTAHFWKIPV